MAGQDVAALDHTATTTVPEYSNLVDWTLSGKYDEEKPILIDAANISRFVTRRKAHVLVSALAGSFDPDSTVCLHLANDILYPILVLAILASECRWTGTNVAYTAHELEHHFRLSKTKYIVTAQEHFEVVRQAVDASGTNAEVILFSDLLEDEHAMPTVHRQPNLHTDICELLGEVALRRTTYDSAVDLSAPPEPKRRDLLHLLYNATDAGLSGSTRNITPDSIAALMQTSGTTGLPKMAARSHRSMIIEQQTIQDNNNAKPYEVRRLYCAPIFHGFSAPEMIFNALRLGQTSYFMRIYNDTFAQKVYDLHITEICGAPPLLLRLVNQPGAQRLLQSLRLIFYGGAALTPELRKKTLDLFNRKPRIIPVYGMTEGGWFTTLKYPEDEVGGSVGRPIAGYQVKIVPQKNTELCKGQSVGEILVRGPQLMSGYFGNAMATVQAFTDGWLKTGDVGYITDGKVHLVDRAKDLIKVSGFQVSPTELENALLRHPAVLDAAVVAMGEDVTEHPVACVVVEEDSRITADMVKKHLRCSLTSYKVSRCEVRFVKGIPKSPAGKILRNVLREHLRASNGTR